MLRIVFIVLFSVFSVFSAHAEAYSRLSGPEISERFLGATLIGETARSAIPWEECISPSGETVYSFEGETKSGKLVVTEDSRACFVYDSGPSCFDVFERGSTLLLSGTTEFKVNRIEQGISACSVGGPLS